MSHLAPGQYAYDQTISLTEAEETYALLEAVRLAANWQEDTPCRRQFWCLSGYLWLITGEN